MPSRSRFGAAAADQLVDAVGYRERREPDGVRLEARWQFVLDRVEVGGFDLARFGRFHFFGGAGDDPVGLFRAGAADELGCLEVVLGRGQQAAKFGLDAGPVFEGLDRERDERLRLLRFDRRLFEFEGAVADLFQLAREGCRGTGAGRSPPPWPQGWVAGRLVGAPSR
jgi:hypothetical protein